MKSVADQACLNCHSADIVRQQRLNEKQWTASVNKMIGWGASVPEGKKDPLVAYLVEHFGPDNDRFQPVVTGPAKSR
jgi:quinoprotein glucose dehydrogenase